MRTLVQCGMVLALLPATAAAQNDCLKDFKMPAVGSWAEYKGTYRTNEPATWRYAVIGSETRDGKELKWLEFKTTGDKADKNMVYQMLTPGTPAEFGQVEDAVFKSGDKPAQAGQQSDAAKDSQRRINEFAEAAAQVSGPAGNPECVWLGRRVVSLLWRDDLDTAFRHLDLYDRFGCPGPHIQATFRCLVRQGNIDPKQQETLNGRVHACWLNPTLDPAPATAAAPPAPAPAATSGGTTKR